MFGQPLDPLDLLRKYLDVMSDDWRNDENRYSIAILSINEHLSSLDKCITDFINIQDLNEFGYPSIVDVGSGANDNNNNLDNSNISFFGEECQLIKHKTTHCFHCSYYCCFKTAFFK